MNARTQDNEPLPDPENLEASGREIEEAKIIEELNDPEGPFADLPPLRK